MEEKKSLQQIVYDYHKRIFSSIQYPNDDRIENIVEKEIDEYFEENPIKHDGGTF